MATNISTIDYLSKSALKRQGWTEGAIAKFLGQPDLKKPNAYSRLAPETELFLKARIDAVKETKDFRQWERQAKARLRGSSPKSPQSADETKELVKMLRERITLSIRGNIKRFRTVEQLEEAAIARRFGDELDVLPTPDEVDPDDLFWYVENYVGNELVSRGMIVNSLPSSLPQKKIAAVFRQTVSDEVLRFYSEISDRRNAARM